uniref:Uncharacterized protein n=1 Tax=Romanomermis culicivorax TaxID=13658 RepID=A0A915J5R6_ROMCU
MLRRRRKKPAHKCISWFYC